jgi:hypothetical protein
LSALSCRRHEVRQSFCQPGALTAEQAMELVGLSQRRLIEGRASARAWRVAAAAWGQTLGYQRGWDTIFVEELGRLANIGDRRDTRRAIKECVELGALQWEPDRWIPPKGRKGRPSLLGLPGASKVGANHPHLRPSKVGADHPHNRAMNLEAMSNGSVEGADHRRMEGHETSEPGVERPEDGPPQRDTPAPDVCPIHHEQKIEGRCVSCFSDEAHARWVELQGLSPSAAQTMARFGDPPAGSFHGDERTGDGIGDDERSQREWAAANPIKARARFN